MRKKGFTLVELLAVIVILAIISLISVPIILNIVEKSKKSSVVISAEGYIDSLEKQIAVGEIIKEDKIQAPGKYVLIKNSEYESNYSIYLNDIVKLKGTYPSDGYVILNEKKNVETALFEIDGYFIECSKNKCRIAIDQELKKWEPILKAANIEYNENSKIDEILNKNNSLKITGNDEVFKLLIGNKGLFKSFIQLKYGDTALYQNGAITEPLISSDDEIIEIMKQSSKYEVVSFYKKYNAGNKTYVTLYDSPAFVFGISQNYVGRTDRYTYHGSYQNGTQYITDLQMKYTLNKNENLHGLIYPVNKFADKVEQIPNYPNSASYSATSYAAIYKLDIKE